MSEKLHHYTYRPLDFQDRGFRVATLQPAADFSALICCDLAEVTLNSHPDYEAISYVWGNPSNQVPIYLEDAESRVTANLALALRYLRLKDEPRTLWVDAICIDQSNIEEPSQQVQLMKDIYSSCIRDLIWLGEAGGRTEEGLNMLVHMKSLNIQRRGGKQFNKMVTLRDLAANRNDDFYLDIWSIVAQPGLWGRVWVMQEIACCPEALLVIGHLTMSWTIMSSILDHSGIPDRYHLPFGHQPFAQDVWDVFGKTQVIEHQRDIIRSINPINSTLLDVLSRFRAADSTDPRDKIYGLLGLATDDHGIIPDYRKSVQDVYIDVARSQLNATQNLDLITQSLWPLRNTPALKSYELGYDVSETSATLDLPSWLPNFSTRGAASILFAQRSIFAAGTATFSETPVISPAGVLTLTGAVVGTIATLKPIGEMIHADGQYLSPWAHHWLPTTLSGTQEAPGTYPTGGDAFESYWRTLMTDCVAYPSRRLSEPDIVKYAGLFDSWRKGIAPSPLVTKVDGSPVSYHGELLYSMEALMRWDEINCSFENRRFAELNNALYAMVPWDGSRNPDSGAQMGDVLAVVEGGKVPLVLRDKVMSDKKQCVDGNELWEIVGTAYVHRLMDGLAAEWVERGTITKQSFHII